MRFTGRIHEPGSLLVPEQQRKEKICEEKGPNVIRPKLQFNPFGCQFAGAGVNPRVIEQNINTSTSYQGCDFSRGRANGFLGCEIEEYGFNGYGGIFGVDCLDDGV
jgi:hypothetical protein